MESVLLCAPWYEDRRALCRRRRDAARFTRRGSFYIRRQQSGLPQDTGPQRRRRRYLEITQQHRRKTPDDRTSLPGPERPATTLAPGGSKRRFGKTRVGIVDCTPPDRRPVRPPHNMDGHLRPKTRLIQPPTGKRIKNPAPPTRKSTRDPIDSTARPRRASTYITLGFHPKVSSATHCVARHLILSKHRSKIRQQERHGGL